MPPDLCLLCVHAHPDDEALFSAGVMARYAAEGVRSVLVTCTDGGLGFAPDGDRAERRGPRSATRSRAARRAELEASCALLGVDRLETLGLRGLRDDGLAAERRCRRRSSNQPLDEVAARIAAVIDEERPQVVVTYDANGFYGHPDHVFTHRATMAAVGRARGSRRSTSPRSRRRSSQGFLDLAAGRA